MSAENEEFIQNLLARLTTDEKIGQLNQYFTAGNFNPEVIRQGNAGSFIYAEGALTGFGQSKSATAETSNHIQRLALESPKKIPQLFGRDVIHGYRTVFPVPLAQAASFDPALIEQAAAIAAQEASADGIKWTFAPMLDVARDPRWGRVSEGNGEDPWLGAQIAAAAVRGFQGQDFSAPNKLIACAKHFVGYGAAAGGRDYDEGEISEPTLHDIYLPPFLAAINAGVGSLMPAFSDLNGTPVTAHRRLLTDLLRGEWGFDGFVVSDWKAIPELVNHGIAEDQAHAAALALQAGVDMDMSSATYLTTLASNLHDNKISIEDIDTAVLRILRMKQRAGLFERPFTDPERAPREILGASSREFARKFARDCMVLLKNDGNLLPFDSRIQRIALVGPLIHARGELLGAWAPDGREEDVTPLAEAIQRLAPRGVELLIDEHADKAVRLAQRCDAVVLVVGEHPNRSGENCNVSDLGLPPGQAELVEAVAAQGKPVVLVVIAGRPLAIPRPVAQVESVLYAWQPGIEGGAALAEILFGLEAPSARLPISFPRATGQVPIYYNHKNSGRPVGLSLHFQSRYVDLPSTPLFPFGYGLTYTSFAYANLKLSGETLRGKLEISADVTNTGGRAGSELAQLYVRDMVGSLTRPIRELKGCQRLALQPGETRRVSFTLTENDLVFTRANGSRGVEPGKFQVWIAPDSRSGLQGEFRL